MTYILKHLLKSISVLMSSFTDCVIKKGNGKYILRIRSFTDEGRKLIVWCNACRGRKKDTMTLTARSIYIPERCKDSCLVQEAWAGQTGLSIIWDATVSISTCDLKARGKICIAFNT